jgi:hypothetical protein
MTPRQRTKKAGSNMPPDPASATQVCNPGRHRIAEWRKHITSILQATPACHAAVSSLAPRFTPIPHYLVRQQDVAVHQILEVAIFGRQALTASTTNLNSI